MRTTNLGQLTVSAQGLGCMGMSEWYGPTDWDESIATIHRALDLGVTFIDTADIYGAGHNEVLVGRGMAHRRDDVQLATKFGIDRSGGDAHRIIRGEHDYVKRACESSLLRLGVEVIDVYYLHRPPQTAEIEETVGAMAELVAEGKVRYLGLSEVSGELLRRAHAVHPITAVQSEYSLWTRDVETDVIGVMRELGVGLVPYSPLGRGFLTATVDVATLDEKDFRRRNPRFGGQASTANQAIADLVREVADAKGRAAGAGRAGVGLRPGRPARRPRGPHPGHQADQVAGAERGRPRRHPDLRGAGSARPPGQPGHRRPLLTRRAQFGPYFYGTILGACRQPRVASLVSPASCLAPRAKCVRACLGRHTRESLYGLRRPDRGVWIYPHDAADPRNGETRHEHPIRARHDAGRAAIGPPRAVARGACRGAVR